jgi:hypothetical protein
MYNLKVHNFNSSPNTVMVIKSGCSEMGNFKEWTEYEGRDWPKADQERRPPLNEEKVSAGCGKRPGSQK